MKMAFECLQHMQMNMKCLTGYFWWPGIFPHFHVFLVKFFLTLTACRMFFNTYFDSVVLFSSSLPSYSSWVWKVFSRLWDRENKKYCILVKQRKQRCVLGWWTFARGWSSLAKNCLWCHEKLWRHQWVFFNYINIWKKASNIARGTKDPEYWVRNWSKSFRWNNFKLISVRKMVQV